ncbi:MAG: hypothetical protein ABIH78_04730 [Candidatus Peregrinibacteria bacterium]
MNRPEGVNVGFVRGWTEGENAIAGFVNEIRKGVSDRVSAVTSSVANVPAVVSEVLTAVVDDARSALNSLFSRVMLKVGDFCNPDLK